MARAVVDSVIRIEETALAPKSLALLERALTFLNPEYVKRSRLGLWCGATPEELNLFERTGPGELVIPRGAVRALRDAARAMGDDVSFEDRRAVHEPLDLRFDLELRDYQDAAARALTRHTQGFAVLPCGAGKTVIGAAAIARCCQPALVLVHTYDLLDQWRGTLRAALGVEPGVISEGRSEPSPITVGMVQTLAGLAPSALADLGRRFGVVIIDEAHHSPATSFRQILAAMPARYRFGLTATPERADGLTPLLGFCLGPQVFSIDHEMLVEAGHLLIPEVKAVRTGTRPEAETYAQLVTALACDDVRNRLVVELVEVAVFEGHSTLVLSGRVEHCEDLAALLRAADVEAAALTGKVARAHRGEVLERFRAGDLKVVCATSLADEGLDVSCLERVVLATPTRAEGRAIQRLGRLMRPHPGKGKPVLVDLVDDHPIALRQYAARRRAYRKVLGCLQ